MADINTNTDNTHGDPSQGQSSVEETANAQLIATRNSEFSDSLDTLLNSYSLQANFGEGDSKINIVLDEYEKSLFLTKAENEIFLNFYSGKNPYGEFFEATEELRRYLDTLVKDATPNVIDNNTGVLSNNSVKYQLPSDLAFITLEEVTYSDDPDKKCTSNGFKASVYPITQDEYARVKDNPFRGPTKYKVLRLDKGDKVVELIHHKDYNIGTYYIRYLKKPEPIILTDLKSSNLYIEGKNEVSTTDMNPILFDLILNRAAALALQSKSIGMPTNTKNE